VILVQKGPDERAYKTQRIGVYRNIPYGIVGKLKKTKDYRALRSFLALIVMKRFSYALDQPSRARESSIRYQIKGKKGASTSSILGRRVSKGHCIHRSLTRHAV
jgi:hypothetical protein